MARRLRRGELVTLAGLLLLVVSLFLRWFDVEQPRSAQSFAVLGSPASGWGLLGHPWLEVPAAAGTAAGVAVLLGVRSGPGRPTYGAVTAIVVALPIAAVALVLTVVRVLVASPTPRVTDLGGTSILSTLSTTDRLPELLRAQASLSPAIGSWVGLVALVVLTAGLWVALADDRTSGPDAAVVPPAARPAPGSSAAGSDPTGTA